MPGGGSGMIYTLLSLFLYVLFAIGVFLSLAFIIYMLFRGLEREEEL